MNHETQSVCLVVAHDQQLYNASVALVRRDSASGLAQEAEAWVVGLVDAAARDLAIDRLPGRSRPPAPHAAAGNALTLWALYQVDWDAVAADFAEGIEGARDPGPPNEPTSAEAMTLARRSAEDAVFALAHATAWQGDSFHPTASEAGDELRARVELALERAGWFRERARHPADGIVCGLLHGRLSDLDWPALAGRAPRRDSSVEAAAPAPARKASKVKATPAGKARQLSDAALRVLGSAEVDVEAGVLRLPGEKLERALYVEVNEALVAIGGKWNRKAGAHLFAGDPRDAVDQILLDGCFTDAKKAFDFFPTPLPLAARLVEMAGVRPGDRALEPSAGPGAIADALKAAGAVVMACEVQPDLADALEERGYDKVLCADFIAHFTGLVGTRSFDVICMNPPFGRQADVEHVKLAMALLAPGGRLVSVMSSSVRFRDNEKTKAFRARVEAIGGAFEDLPALSFRESGTDVNTCVLTVRKPGEAKREPTPVAPPAGQVGQLGLFARAS